jgi:hypothetical protein
VSVVGEAVEGGAGEERLTEELRSLGEGAVGGDDHRSLLVSFGHDLVEDTLP